MDKLAHCLFALGLGLFALSLGGCEACQEDSPREELREDVDQTRENVDDAIDESRVGMNR